jgi:hypothetical protein
MREATVAFLLLLSAISAASARPAGIMRNCLRAQITAIECRGYAGLSPAKHRADYRIYPGYGMQPRRWWWTMHRRSGR